MSQRLVLATACTQHYLVSHRGCCWCCGVLAGGGAGGSGGEAELLHLLHHSAADLLRRRLRPDNFPAFAELLTAAVLQVRP